MAGRVAGKKALITGAAQGLGAAQAMMLAREGAQVLLADINAAGAAQQAEAINAELGAGIAFSVALRMLSSRADAEDVCQQAFVDAFAALERAIGLMRERLERNPAQPEAWAMMAGWLANRGRRDEAEAAIRAMKYPPLGERGAVGSRALPLKEGGARPPLQVRLGAAPPLALVLLPRGEIDVLVGHGVGRGERRRLHASTRCWCG